jgi:Hg(II)-responsive transcriptional regulator
MSDMTIGQVATQVGVGIETIRFYERKRLIDEPRRRPSGYRQYNPEVVYRIRFIRHAKELGFTLREIKELLELRVEPGGKCGDVLELAEAKTADINERIRKLRKMRRTLSALTRDCQRGRPTDECPILKALDRQNGESP